MEGKPVRLYYHKDKMNKDKMIKAQQAIKNETNFYENHRWHFQILT